MDALVKYIGHIDETRRPAGFANKVMAIGTYHFENLEELMKLVNNEAGAIIRIQGMLVAKDPAEITDTTKIRFDQRMFVPIHMITHVTMEVSMMQQMPQLDADNNYVLEDGSKVPIQ